MKSYPTRYPRVELCFGGRGGGCNWYLYKRHWFHTFLPGKENIFQRIAYHSTAHSGYSVFVRARLCLNVNHGIVRVGSAPWRFPGCLVDRETESKRGKGLRRISLQAMLVRGEKGRRGLYWMNWSHFSILHISVGHMLMAHLLLLPWELTQRQSQNGYFNAKHIGRPEGRRRCGLGCWLLLAGKALL